MENTKGFVANTILSRLTRYKRAAELTCLIITLALISFPSIGPIAHATINNYVVWANGGNGGQSITYITANWNVPAAPSNTNGGPINFLWIGIQNSAVPWIAQPILGWGCCIQTTNGREGGNFWYISAYFLKNGVSNSTPIIHVNTGDQIAGYAFGGTLTQCGGGIGYHIFVDDNSIGQASEEYICTGNYGTVAFIALESYNINSCNQLPNTAQEQFYLLYTTPSILTWTPSNTGNSPQCFYSQGPSTSLRIHSYPTNDIYCRSHGRAYDQALPVPWWPPYQSNYEISTSCSTFDYTETLGFALGTSHYIQEAASGFVPSNAWHTQIYVSGQLKGEGDVGRNQILQVSITPNAYSLYWNPNG